MRVIINGFVRVSDKSATTEKCSARVIIDGKDMVVLCVNSSRIVDPKSLAMAGTRHSLCAANKTRDRARKRERGLSTYNNNRQQPLSPRRCANSKMCVIAVCANVPNYTLSQHIIFPSVRGGLKAERATCKIPSTVWQLSFEMAPMCIHGCL